MAKKITEKSLRAKRAGKPYADKIESSKVLNETAVQYGSPAVSLSYAAAQANDVDILTNIHEIPSEERSKLVKTGITKKFLLALKKAMALDYKSLTDILSISKEEILSKGVNEKFSKSVSEKIVSLAEIHSYGVDVFGVTEYFQRWFVRPNIAMGLVAPITLANTNAGLLEVKRALGRIEHGIIS